MSFWKKGMGGSQQRSLWMTVVVNYKRSRVRRQRYGEVVTAYFAKDTPPESERRYYDE
jgi:hypothetical protein